MASAQSPDGDTPVPTTELDPPAGQVDSLVTDPEWRAMQTILNIVYEHRTAEGHDPSKVFHRKVNKRAIPSYYEVIKEPIALSSIKAKINTRSYKDFPEFVRDFALISHNAQVYNRPDAGAYQDALEIKAVLQAELKKLVESGLITLDTAALPYLGEIPAQDDIPAEENEGAEEEEDDEEEEDEEGGEESDDSPGKRRGRGRPRGSTTKAKTEDGPKDEAQKAAEADLRKKRGRPPRVDTPMEARIKNILKGMRRFKNSEQEWMINQFDRLPDKIVMPGYYEEIKAPMAVDVLKKKLKRKKYQSMDQFMSDVDLMFENAKAFNEDNSQIYKDAVELQRESRLLIEQEQKKPDSDFVMEDGRLPLPEGILHDGEIYKVGDWVHIQNANDLTKPIVTQIYRTWQDASGQKFVNACWYYRPEQTVHRFDKHFFENEVVKTGQYRDHSIDEIVDRCFVMFITRFNKGRPRNFPRDKEIYVCEARYNEEKHTLNKIKTWASCLPDEVRDKDYEMELYPEPKKMKKHPSPIAYLLKDEMKESDELPKPDWGADNAPPKIGAVHKRPRDPKESPPPEPTPTPPPEPTPPPPPPPRQATQQTESYSRSQTSNFPVPTPARQATMTSNTPINHTFPPPQTQRSYQANISPAPPTAQTTDKRVNGYSAHTPHTTFNSRLPQTEPSNPHTQKYQLSNSAYAGPTSANYKAPQPIEVFSLNDAANANIPPDIREQFQRDDQGRVLFFTAPPFDTSATRLPNKDGSPPLLGHSVAYLAAKPQRDAAVRERRKRKAEEAAKGEERAGELARRRQEQLSGMAQQVTRKAMGLWERHMVLATREDWKAIYGEEKMEEGVRAAAERMGGAMEEAVGR